MRGQVLKYLIPVLMLLNVFCFSASAQVDWANGVVRVKGMGLPSPNLPEVQAKLLAKRAAMSDAYRNMAEMVNAVQVTSETVVKNFVTESDEIHTRVQAFIQGAVVLDEKQNDDGSYEVTMEAPIYGVGSLSDALVNEVAKKSDTYAYVTGDETGSEAYTGLLIDARGIEIKPSLAPAVFNTNAEIVYDASMLDASAYSQGVAAFVEGEKDFLNEGMLPSHPFMFAANSLMSFDIAAFFIPYMAVKDPKVMNKVGNKPLVIKAIDPKTTSGNVVNLAPYNVVVSAEDGKKILNANKTNNILTNGNVAVVTGNSAPLISAGDIPSGITNILPICPKGMKQEGMISCVP